MKEKISVDSNVLFFAFRYSLGRETYAPHLIATAIRENINKLSTDELNRYVQEIEACPNYGMAFDREHWLRLASDLKKAVDERESESTSYGKRTL